MDRDGKGSRRVSPWPLRIDPGDLIGGFSAAFVLIPQSLAYATPAGMPVERGLFVAALAPIAAAFFASSPYLGTGPTAITSLLTFGALGVLAVSASSEYVALAALLALLVGAVRVALGLLRVGFIACISCPSPSSQVSRAERPLSSSRRRSRRCSTFPASTPTHSPLPSKRSAVLGIGGSSRSPSPSSWPP